VEKWASKSEKFLKLFSSEHLHCVTIEQTGNYGNNYDVDETIQTLKHEKSKIFYFNLIKT
jgi:hypothetical protein